MGSRTWVLLLVAVCVGARLSGAATLLPLDAEDASLLPPGMMEVYVGANGAWDVQPLFRDEERDEWSAPSIGISTGLGTRAEAQLRWELLAIESDGGSWKYGAGDARLFTKVRVFSESEYELSWLPATAVHFGVKLPNASRADGFGTDETDVFGSVLLSRSLGPMRLHGNLGIGILGNPGPFGRQDDLILYDAAAVVPGLARWSDAALSLFAEVGGGAESGPADRHRARLGARLDTESVAGYVGASAGLDDHSEDFGIRFGVIVRLRVFSE